MTDSEKNYKFDLGVKMAKKFVVSWERSVRDIALEVPDSLLAVVKVST